MISVNRVRPSIEVVEWQESKDAFSEQAIKHLDLGSANYGPDTLPSAISADGTEKNKYPRPFFIKSP